jgi:hypothetical protein
MADARGGPRQGAVGGRYPNRSDMTAPGQAITPSNLPPSQAYGQGVQQARGLAAVPAGSPPSPAAGGGGGQQVALAPGDVPSLRDPTANPDEPVTAGLPLGPGAGPEALNVTATDSPELAILRSLYLEYPNPDIRRLMAFLEETLQF